MRRDFITGCLILAAIGAGAAWSWWSDGIIAMLVDVDQTPAEKVDAFRTYFDRWGPAAPLVYIVVVVVEAVIAPIPGAMLYLPGGVIFGGFWGGTLSLVGNVIGAGVCAQLMKTLVGRRWSERFFEGEKLEGVRRVIVRHGVLSVAVFRLNPLTSSDLVSYAAGLTPLSVSRVMIGTGIGMIPLAYAQAYLSVGLFAMFPWLIWPLVVGCAVYLAVAVVIAVRVAGIARPRVVASEDPAPEVAEP